MAAFGNDNSCAFSPLQAVPWNLIVIFKLRVLILARKSENQINNRLWFKTLLCRHPDVERETHFQRSLGLIIRMMDAGVVNGNGSAVFYVTNNGIDCPCVLYFK